ncbi:hypothetical protein [Qingshengfaniella alkalisoli]|uniref:Uncharacterized protein n=1 Tax=Qingshengfaniella alkalisoli TaxID=2599296 RepID=A0A5B8J0E7_9RHOB|nr:hypothetical protein [Qingshengfaniella alkalisoli]QDY70358.1 hypothetical protein FPZ52_11515 [Qingshengfaniella alkalisoli]
MIKKFPDTKKHREDWRLPSWFNYADDLIRLFGQTNDGRAALGPFAGQTGSPRRTSDRSFDGVLEGFAAQQNGKRKMDESVCDGLDLEDDYDRPVNYPAKELALLIRLAARFQSDKAFRNDILNQSSVAMLTGFHHTELRTVQRLLARAFMPHEWYASRPLHSSTL